MSVKDNAPSIVRNKLAWSRLASSSSELDDELTSTILDALPVGVYVATGQARAVYRNGAAAKLLGRRFRPGSSILRLAKRHSIYRAGSDELYPSERLPIVRATGGDTCTADDLEIRQGATRTRLVMNASPRFDRSGRLVFVVATLMEIGSAGETLASHPLAESLAPASEVRLVRNFEAIGQLAAGVAHEINTPMQYIGDNTAFLGTTIRRLLDVADSFERLLGSCRDGRPLSEQIVDESAQALSRGRLHFLREQGPTAIEQTLAGIDQVRSIVQALKEFSHPGEEHPVNVDVNHLVQLASTVTRNSWRYVADLTLDLCERPRLIRGHPQELGQVLINLIVNAAHAVEERGQTEGERPPGRIIVRTRSIADQVEIQVSDNGGGIPEAIRDRIMAPYFTTKPAGKGTGQGLPLARRVIVDQHRGSLSFDSEVGVGTTFFIVLPGAPDE